MEILNTSNGQKLNVPFNAWALAKISGTELVEFHLDSGESIPEHTNPVNVVFYILKGVGILSLEEESFELQEGDSYAVKKDLQREWKNTGKSALQVLVIKS